MADAYIQVDTRADTSKMGQDLRGASKEVQNLTTQFEKTYVAIKKQEAAIANMTRQLDAISSGAKTPASITAMEASLKKANAEIAPMIQKMDALGEAYRKASNEADQNRIAAEMDKLGAKIEPTRIKAEQLKKTLADLKLNPQNSIEAQALKDKIANATSELDASKNKATQLKDRLAKAFNPEPVKKTTKEVKKLSGETSKVSKNAKKAGDGMQKLAVRLKSVVLSAAIFSVVTKVLTSLRDTLGKVLLSNERFAKSFNNIKANLLTAFAPIWEKILPAILSFMGVLEQVTLVAANFISLIFGKSIADSKKAAQGLQDQAGAMEDVGKEADKTAKKLAGFDKINQLAAESSSSVAKEAAKGIDFGDVKTLDWMKDIVWMNDLKRMLDSILTLVKLIAATWNEVWRSEYGTRLLESFNGLLSMIFNLVADIADAFTEAWKRNENGKKLIESIFYALTNVLNLITSIGNAFRQAWNDGTGVAIAENLLQIFTNLFSIVGLFALKLQEAWEANNNGVLLWQAILGFVNDILTVINKMTLATVEWVKGLNLEPLMGAIVRLAQSFRGLASVIVDGLGWAYENVLLPYIKWLVEAYWPVGMELISAGFVALTSIIEALKPWATWLWETFLKPFGEWTGEIVIKALQWVTEKLTAFSDWARENPEALERIANIVLGFFAGIVTYYTAKRITKLIVDIGDAFTKLGTLLNPATIKILAIAAAVGALVYIILEISRIWDKLTPAQQTITMLGALAAAAVTAALAIAVFHTSWTVGIGAAAIVGGLAMLMTARAFAGANLPTASFSSVGASAMSRSIPPSAQSMYNATRMGNPLPMLATGTVAKPNAPFAAIIGDNKREPEIVSPLSTMKQAFKEAMVESGGTFGSNGNQPEAILMLDGREVGRMILPYIEKEKTRIGVRMKKA